MPVDLPVEKQQAGLIRVPHEWLRGYLIWDCYYLVAFAATIVFVLSLDDASAKSKPLAAVLLLCCGVWYAVYGRSLMKADDESWRGVLYLGVVLAFFIGAETFSSASSIALVAIIPQAYWTMRPLYATGVIVVFSLVPIGVGTFQSGAVVQTVIAQGPLALAIISFSAIVGTWTTRIIGQSRERADLITELESTRSELAAVSKQAGAVAERERLAGEIHDAIAQSLSSIVMLVQASKAALGQLNGLSGGQVEAVTRAGGQLDLVADTAREALAEARGLIEALRPSALDSSSLPEALQRLAAKEDRDTGVPVRFELLGEPAPLPVATEVALLRVTQEALANVRKHAKAAEVEVRLSYAGGQVGVEVHDDGVGFDPDADSPGYGLVGMRNRIEQVAGRCELRSVPEHGTTLMVEVPV
ncbi:MULTISPECIES: sensor histidine kinase [Amycolatopsis]|uniref:Sensor histidine kinase n=1 Tax=Amycolatopsis albidoflavus TaxID=102226 RepID=A0ABW5HRL6_9PSEU